MNHSKTVLIIIYFRCIWQPRIVFVIVDIEHFYKNFYMKKVEVYYNHFFLLENVIYLPYRAHFFAFDKV